LGALQRHPAEPEFVQARHEEAAAFMAVAHSKFALGQLGIEEDNGSAGGVNIGVVMSTQGPGAVHLLNGLYDAMLEIVPSVAIVRRKNLSVLSIESQHEIDLKAIFKDVVPHFCEQISVPEQVTAVIDRAFRTALTFSSLTVVILPNDEQQQNEVLAGGEHS